MFFTGSHVLPLINENPNLLMEGNELNTRRTIKPTNRARNIIAKTNVEPENALSPSPKLRFLDSPLNVLFSLPGVTDDIIHRTLFLLTG